MYVLVSELFSSYQNLQLANGGYYFAALAGLTVLTGLSGQISLGHGALMAVGAYTVALLVGNEQWAVVAALAASVVVSVAVGVPSAPPLRGCAGPTWPAQRWRLPSACRRSPTSTRTRWAARTA